MRGIRWSGLGNSNLDLFSLLEPICRQSQSRLQSGQDCAGNRDVGLQFRANGESERQLASKVSELSSPAPDGSAWISREFKAAEARGGMNATNIAGHGVRAGMAAQAALNGSSERAIAKTMRHRPRRVLRSYIRPGEMFRENASASLGL